jgi:hypothetical protein
VNPANTNDANRHGDQSLDWLAHCYVCGELSPAELTEFETRLGDNQAAREAVARAVEINELVLASHRAALAARTRAARPRTSVLRPLAWASVGVAAAVMAMALLGEFRLGGFFVGHERGRPPEQLADADLLATDEPELLLAATWNELRDGGGTEIQIEPADLDLADEDPTGAGDWPAIETIAMTEDATTENFDELSAVAPAWLVVAVDADQLSHVGATEPEEE